MLLLSTVKPILLLALTMSTTTTTKNSHNHPDDSSATAMSAVYDRLAKHLLSKLDGASDQHQYWVAIAGSPGSGKTTSAEAVAKRLNHQQQGENCCVVVPMDGFHYSQARLVELHGPDAMRRRGAPWTFDAEGLLHALQQAKQSGRAVLPSYSREISDPVPGGVEIQPFHRIVLVEGLHLLHERDPRWAPLQQLWDERWFVKAPSREIQKERLVQRSLKTWSDAKIQQWGPGIEGARKRVDANDSLNMDLLAYCEEIADEVIVTM